MTTQIVKLNDIQIKGLKANQYTVTYLNRLFSKQLLGQRVSGLIDTDKHDLEYNRKVIRKAQQALQTEDINKKNNYLHKYDGANKDGYSQNSINDANSDIHKSISTFKKENQSLKHYTSDTLIMLKGPVEDCVHPLTYQQVKFMLEK